LILIVLAAVLRSACTHFKDGEEVSTEDKTECTWAENGERERAAEVIKAVG